jgi:hypothetical protein
MKKTKSCKSIRKGIRNRRKSMFKGGRDENLFRSYDENPKCNKRQDIIELENDVMFPHYSGDCIFIHDNDHIQEIPIFPDTVNFVSIKNNYNLEKLLNNQFPDHLTELYIEDSRELNQIYLPKYLQRLTIVDMDFTPFKELPKNLIVLKIIGCDDVDFDYLPENLLSLEIEYARNFINRSKIISILSRYKKKHPACEIKTDFKLIDLEVESIPTKMIFLQDAYNIMDMEDHQIIEFLDNNKDYIVGKLYNEVRFIDKIRLADTDFEVNSSSKIFKMSNLGFGVNNLYISYKYIEYILNSEHRYWLFEDTEKQNEKSMVTLIKIKNANSILGKFFRRSSSTLKKKSRIENNDNKSKENNSKIKLKRCEKGTRRNKKTGLCEKIQKKN